MTDIKKKQKKKRSNHHHINEDQIEQNINIQILILLCELYHVRFNIMSCKLLFHNYLSIYICIKPLNTLWSDNNNNNQVTLIHLLHIKFLVYNYICSLLIKSHTNI